MVDDNLNIPCNRDWRW